MMIRMVDDAMKENEKGGGRSKKLKGEGMGVIGKEDGRRCTQKSRQRGSSTCFRRRLFSGRRRGGRISSRRGLNLLVGVIIVFDVLDHLSAEDGGLGMNADSENTLFVSSLDRTRGKDVVTEEDLALKEAVSTLVIDPLSGPATGLVATHDEE